MFRSLKFIVTVVYVGTLLLGCNAKQEGLPSTSAPPPRAIATYNKTIPASLTGYNHTNKTIAAFYVNGEWGGNIRPETGGGSFVCCVNLPNPWRSGYSVTVSWEDHEGKMQKREVSVPKYDPETLSDFNVHFLRSGEIKVFAVRMGLRNRDYPLTGPESELKPGVPIEKVF